MKSAKSAWIIFAALVGIFSTTAAALATGAVATTAVNVRSGPGVSFAILDTLYGGEPVTVTQCQSGWCYVEHSGPDGWVSGNYLAHPTPAPTPTPTPHEPDVSFGISVGPGGPSFGFSIGNSPVIIAPPAPVIPKVCFYKGNNYAGAAVCVNAGTQDNQLGAAWNNKISSIQVQPGASVTVCRNWFYGGFCQTYNSSVAVLNPFLNNDVSSFKTF